MSITSLALSLNLGRLSLSSLKWISATIPSLDPSLNLGFPFLLSKICSPPFPPSSFTVLCLIDFFSSFHRDLSNNQLSGTIPSNWTSASSLILLYVLLFPIILFNSPFLLNMDKTSSFLHPSHPSLFSLPPSSTALRRFPFPLPFLRAKEKNDILPFPFPFPSFSYYPSPFSHSSFLSPCLPSFLSLFVI